jgi:hypothetical protein
MEPLEITIELASPVILSAPWMTFDGIVMYGMGALLFGKEWRHLASSSNRSLWAAIPMPLLDARKDGSHLYHASCSRFEDPVPASTTFFQHFSSENLGQLLRTATRSKYMVVGGEFKQAARTYPAITSKRVRFWCVGDPITINQILAESIGIGKRLDIGHGHVKACNVKPIPADLSIKHPGFGLNRPVPVRFAHEFNIDTGVIANVASRPPCWMQEHHEPCYIPGGFS